MVHQNKAKFRKFPWKRVLGTAVRLTIFSNIQLIKKKFGSNIDGHMKEQSWNNEACFYIIFKLIIENPLWNWKNMEDHISPIKVPITYENFEVLMSNLIRCKKPSYWRLAESFNCVCWYEVGSEFLQKQWPPGKHRFAGSRKRLMHDFKVSTPHVRDISGW